MFYRIYEIFDYTYFSFWNTKSISAFFSEQYCVCKLSQQLNKKTKEEVKVNTIYYKNVVPKFYGTKDVAKILEISESKDYNIIRILNKNEI